MGGRGIKGEMGGVSNFGCFIIPFALDFAVITRLYCALLSPILFSNCPFHVIVVGTTEERGGCR